MTRAALIALALAGCSYPQQHPLRTAMAANVALVATAGVCAAECNHATAGVADGVLVGELAVSSSLSMLFLVWFISYAMEDKR